MKAKNQWIKIVSDAEMSCLAISSLCTEKKIESLISIDERTTRILAEKPQDLEKIISRKLHQKVNLKGEGIKAFKEKLENQILKLVKHLEHDTIVIIQGQDIKLVTGLVGSGND